MSVTDASMIMPLPSVSWACTMVSAGPGTMRCASNPNACTSHSMAALALR
ncbi:Uncharacterised protein [Bordetella pertussis]|nr:Uncharacterised protein [Bordetella pertussis]